MRRISLNLLPILPLLAVSCGPAENDDPVTPPVYEALRTTEAITVDGALTDPQWEHAAWTDDFVDISGEGLPAPPLRTRVKLLWNREFLFVGAELEEPHVWATLQDRDAIVYQDDDFEVFLDPDGDGLAYFEIEVNPYGTVLDLFMDQPYDQGGKADLEWDLDGLRAAVAIAGSVNDPSDRDGGWTVELAIPWAGLAPPTGEKTAKGRSPDPGDSWRMNLSRVDWPMVVVDGSYQKAVLPSRENMHPESNWVWSAQGTVNMHIPERWGVVLFLADPQNALFDQVP
ncbi:MAG: carbohydrate-binding family 9-like protein [Gemmatimonadetes bacterium]|nr:carbohydrate-binding family 9-like protein [Gemmatimonadota bacterium]